MGKEERKARIWAVGGIAIMAASWLIAVLKVIVA